MEERVQLRIVLVDRGAVRGVDLSGADLLVPDQARRFLG
jgi:hypothetical protein